MVYNSRLGGELRIEPPLRWIEYRDSEFLEPDDRCIKLAEGIVVDDTEDGQVVIRNAVSVQRRWPDWRPTCGVVAELARLATAFGVDHTFHGYLVREGEEAGDVERYWIEGATAKSEEARLTWLDGTEVTL